MSYLKVMSAQDLPDSDPRKNFTLVPIGPGERLVFAADLSYPDDDPHVVALIGRWAGVDTEGFDIPKEEQDRVVALTGNAYVVSDQGKTLASRAPY